MLVSFFRQAIADRRWIRLLQWEALADGGAPGDPDEARRERYRDLLAVAEGLRNTGDLPEDLDVDLLFLSLVGAAEYPCAYPQVVELVTGRRPDDPAFVERYERHLARLAALLRGGATPPSR